MMSRGAAPRVRLPFWMHHEHMEDGKKKGGKSHLLRDINKRLQLQTTVWTELSKIKELDDKIEQYNRDMKEDIVRMIPGELQKFEKEKVQREERVREFCDSQYDGTLKQAYLPGPCGELPVHICLLLGQLELTKDLIENFYSPGPGENSKYDVNVPFDSDMSVWSKLGILKGQDDGGLYTGETLLHIAVVRNEKKLVKWLIEEKGASVAAQATGLFFKARTVSVVEKKPRGKKAPGGTLRTRTMENKESRADFGEFPLSFAASMGYVEIMDVIKRAIDKKAEKPETFSQVLDQYPQKLQGGPAMTKLSHIKHLNYILLNSQDNDGNTALHMAVFHNEIPSILWLLENGGRPSLKLVNSHGYTPLTLAAQCGHVDVFHELCEKMMTTSWEFGTVRHTILNLEQIDTFVVQRPEESENDDSSHAPAMTAAPDPFDPVLNTGHPGWRSALDIIVEDEKTEFLHDRFFYSLIIEKWKKFARRKFLTEKLVPHYLLTVAFVVIVVLRSREIRYRWGLGARGLGVGVEELGGWGLGWRVVCVGGG
jgi:ankyrin repeat protein